VRQVERHRRRRNRRQNLQGAAARRDSVAALLRVRRGDGVSGHWGMLAVGKEAGRGRGAASGKRQDGGATAIAAASRGRAVPPRGRGRSEASTAAEETVKGRTPPLAALGR
jgi:hypothetical protein